MRFVLALLPLVLVVPIHAAEPGGDEFFEKSVRPLLVEKCQQCHGGEGKVKGGLRLTSRDAILKGGDSGPAAVPEKPDKSALIHAVRYIDAPRMPPREKLADAEIEILTRWVKMGLPWPEGGKPIQTGAKFQITDEQRRWWSFQPVGKVKVPEVKDRQWAKSDLDRFILAGLEKKGFKPVAAADKRTLIRRATFDLTGLPPTPSEIDAFLKDESPDAFARVVDRLLESPHYGERWGRHWLDLVRYTDSFDARGIGGEMDIPFAYRYRDWVIQAFNRDMPYDQFVSDQLAGDLIQRKDRSRRDGIIATGMLAIGNWGGGDADKEKLLTDIADDQVDVVSRTFLGLTVACARCHDHKFDPISTADYYGLAGIFFSTHILPNVGPKTNGPPTLRIPLLSPEELTARQQHERKLKAGDKELQEAIRKANEAFSRKQMDKVAEYLLLAHEYRQIQGKSSVAEFAKAKGVMSYALQQWLDFTTVADYALMKTPVKNVLNNEKVHGWRGKPDTPSLLVNTGNEAVKLLTFTLPAKAVSIHPGPTTAVGVAWRSPVNGTVRISGKVADGDSACGDGIAWKIERKHSAGREELASGEIANGAAQKFEAKALEAIAMKQGDMLELIVLPKAAHVCDTTIVEWTIVLSDGSKEWTLAKDLVADPLQGNPHQDQYGNAAVWHFYDLAGASNTAPPPAELLKALAEWRQVTASEKDEAKLKQAATAVQKQFSLVDERSPFWIRNVADDQYLSDEVRDNLRKLRTELDTLRKRPLPPIEMAHGAQDGAAGVHDVRIHVRGRYDRLGDTVSRRFPEILAGDKQTPLKEGSGRKELAEWVTRSDNPLTARVTVNRMWQFHFGEGLVRTPSNFGKLGSPPTHPELLDYLAAEFVKNGWSIKKMHRLLMLSATYQMSSVPSAELLKNDPDNLLWGRTNCRRLEAEGLRDSLLAVSGQLDTKQGGPAERSLDTPRRTVYLITIRSDLNGYASLFDTADPTAPVEKRVVSTVAPQALFMLNHPFVLGRAKQLAKRILVEKQDEVRGIERLYVSLYGRPPSAEEVKLGKALLAAADKPEQAWTEYCHVLLCANEFMYVD